MDFIQAVGFNNISNVNILTLVSGLVVLSTSLYWLFRKRYNLPPGPRCLPILGYYPILRRDAVEVTRELYKKYGKIITIYLGPSRLIIMNDYELVKEAFENPVLQDRPPKLFDFYPDGLGFGIESGDEWREQRRFSMKALKDMGLGNSEWQDNLVAEINDFLKIVEEQGGRPYDIEPLVAATISNIMVGICLGKRFPIGDPTRSLVDEGVTAVTQSFADNSAIVMVFPNVMKFLCKLGLTKFAIMYRRMCTFSAFIKDEIEHRKKTMDQDNREVFIDEYIREMERMKKKKIHTYFNDFNLCGVAKSIVIGGSDTSRTSLVWLILSMAAFLDVQKKVQEEIDQLLGKEGVITWPQRTKLPYTYATVLELLRWKAPGALGVMHRASEDTKLAGYDIPKNTNICANISFIHYNEEVWDDPISFKPERFLDKNGKVVINRVDNYIPFSLGRRVCPGELIASIELFLFLVYMLQKFNILPLEDKPPDLFGINTARFAPNSQKLRFVLRD